MKSKYINTFDTTADYNNYIESAFPEFPNVGYDKEADKVNIRRQSPNDYQIWGTTTATENFNIKLNNTNVEVTVDSTLGEFYLTGWTGTLTSLNGCFNGNADLISIKKFALDTSRVTIINGMFQNCSHLQYVNLSRINTSSVSSAIGTFYGATTSVTGLGIILDFTDCDLSSLTSYSQMFKFNFNSNVYVKDIYITVEATLMKLTNNLSSQGDSYIPSTATIHYNNVDYNWQNNAWTPQN